MKHRIASVNQIPNGEGKPFTVNGKPIAVFNVDGKFYALLNICTHQKFEIDGGPLDGCVVTCPYHGAQYDVRNGKNLSPPATGPIQTFKVSVEGNDLFVEM